MSREIAQKILMNNLTGEAVKHIAKHRFLGEFIIEAMEDYGRERLRMNADTKVCDHPFEFLKRNNNRVVICTKCDTAISKYF